MNLSGQQRKNLLAALNDAFRDKASLEQMLAFELDKNLDTIAGGNSLQDIVSNLIKTAEAQGWVDDLVCAACNNNPGNSQLNNIAQKLIVKNSSTLYNKIEESLKEHKYSDLDELGSGAIGVTYRAIRGDEQKFIVIKTIRNDLLYKIIKSSNQEFKELDNAIKNFKQEAEILSKFEHSHIVLYYDYLTIEYKLLINNPDKKVDNKPYLVRQLNLLFLLMEYIEGETLEELLSKRDTPLENKEALSYIQQIGEALTFVHKKGLLHRDIKPQNIMVRKTTDDAVLIDFGIAREFNSMVTQTHTVAFTQGYAPPEQLEQKAKRGNYTDVYGLAATLYYLLTQAHPTHALLRKSDGSSFVEPKKINSNISDTVNEAILWGMELESSKRPQTVQQWLAKLLSKETSVALKPSQEVPAQSSILEPAPAKQQRWEQKQAEYKNNLPGADDLSSDRTIDYTRLRDLLKAGNWKDADYETYLVMLRVVDREEGDLIRVDELLKFPCTDLRTIDSLWVKYSHKRFGFSVQREIYLDVGGKVNAGYYPGYYDLGNRLKYFLNHYRKFEIRVGWIAQGLWNFMLRLIKSSLIQYEEATFDTSAPRGHLPFFIFLQKKDTGRLSITDNLINNYLEYFSGETLITLLSRLENCNL